jgi:hypothetical protein
MNRYFVALAVLFVVRVIFPISVASAQIAPGDVEIPTGDVWPSREERIYIPRNALIPNSVNDDANAPGPRSRLRQNRRTLGHSTIRKRPPPYRAGTSCL